MKNQRKQFSSEVKKPKPTQSLEVKESSELLKFLIEKFPQKSRNDLKILLRDKRIFVNNAAISQFNHVLVPEDKVEIKFENTVVQEKLRGIKIIFEDKFLIIIEKEAGVLSISTEKQKENTAYSILSSYVKNQDPKNRIFVVHRLDRETSGIMMYAKSERIQKALQVNWNENILERTYLAVVEGKLPKKEDTIASYLVESKALIVYSTKAISMGQHAITHYEVLKSTNRNSLVKLNLETGRKNQIRVHMQDLGNPVVGDEKYGASTNPIKRLGLHAWVLAFKHPISEQEMHFETEIPQTFLKLF
jgi:23S rRNA pseudouridine1911/1915/1917 synthase